MRPGGLQQTRARSFRPLLAKRTLPVSKRSATAAIVSRLFRLELLTAKISSPKLNWLREDFFRGFFIKLVSVAVLGGAVLSMRYGTSISREDANPGHPP